MSLVKVVLFLALSLVMVPAWSAQTCGLFIYEDIGGATVYSLTQSRGYMGRQIHFEIANPRSAPVQSMVSGYCYCVSGPVRLDPAFGGDRDFRIVYVDRVMRGPFRGCLPFLH
ncbi:MAG: hypothetical protein HC902_06020 [Calothrix sp. SM1_5_4]|nr:hypothetical protein [Calothrix sp. SM1_5_4]